MFRFFLFILWIGLAGCAGLAGAQSSTQTQAGQGQIPYVMPLPTFCQPEKPELPTGFCAEGKPGALGYASVNMPIDTDGYVRDAELMTLNGDHKAESFPVFLAEQHLALYASTMLFDFGSNQDYADSTSVIGFAEAGDSDGTAAAKSIRRARTVPCSRWTKRTRSSAATGCPCAILMPKPFESATGHCILLSIFPRGMCFREPPRPISYITSWF